MQKSLLTAVALTLLTFATPSGTEAATCPMLSAALDADAAVECPDPSETTTICVGNHMCKNNLGRYSYPVDGGCPEGWDLVKVGSVPQACDAAKGVTPEPGDCSQLCQNLGTTTSTVRNGNCCTVTVTRTCSPFPS